MTDDNLLMESQDLNTIAEASSECLVTERVSARCDACGQEAIPCHLVEELGRMAYFCPLHCPVHARKVPGGS